LSEEDEERKRKREERLAWLGKPIEHGGGYKPARPGLKEEVGCCLIEAVGSSAFLAVALLSLYSLTS
jgi:hypothetical protein